MKVDEFDLTGEIMPVVKKADDSDVMIYMGSRIINGAGKGIVVATGEQTEYGRILKQTWEQNETYRFHIIKKKYLILVSLLLPAFVINLVQSQNFILVIVFYLLLSIILILLQNNELFSYLLINNEIKNNKRFRIQIRDARALECMNQIDIMCFDKTGVLTTRQMDVKNIYFADGMLHADKVLNNKERASHLIKIACALCNDVLFFEKIDLANPIDKALISFAEKNGINVKEILLQSKRIAVKVSENCGIIKNSKAYSVGRTIERMTLSEVARQSDYCSVFARLLPSQKGDG